MSLFSTHKVPAIPAQEVVPATALSPGQLAAFCIATSVTVEAMPSEVSGLSVPFLLLDGILGPPLGDKYYDDDPNLAQLVEHLNTEHAALKTYLNGFYTNREGTMRYADFSMISAAQHQEVALASLGDGTVGLLYNFDSSNLKTVLAYTLPMGKEDAKRLIENLRQNKRAA